MKFIILEIMKRYIKGEESIFYIKYNGVWCPIACETSSPMSEEADMVNTTTRENGGWETSKPTLQRYSISIAGQAVKEDSPNVLSYWKIRKMKRDRVLIEWQRKNLFGYYIDSGKAYISQISDGNEVENFMTFSATLVGYGKPEESDERVQVFANGDNKIVVNEDDNALLAK